MNHLVRITLNLRQYQCQTCGRFFYINEDDISDYDLDFGCPYGCDDTGEFVREIHTEIKKVKKIKTPSGGN